MEEEWRPIKDYEGLYEVSNMGRVKSLKRHDTLGREKEEKILALANDRLGYKMVSLCKDGKRTMYKVHRLVAIAFIPNPDNLPIINHKDENKSNNNVCNLEWCTYKYNSNYGTNPQRLSEWMKKNRVGENNPNYGKEFSEEHKRKLSEAHKGEKGTWYGCYNDKNPNSKKVFQISKDSGDIIRIWDSMTEASRELNIDYNGISHCCRGKQKTAGGYCWEYADK